MFIDYFCNFSIDFNFLKVLEEKDISCYDCSTKAYFLSGKTKHKSKKHQKFSTILIKIYYQNQGIFV